MSERMSMLADDWQPGTRMLRTRHRPWESPGLAKGGTLPKFRGLDVNSARDGGTRRPMGKV
jgi:hypothetical protein